jgi:hypothetical protein
MADESKEIARQAGVALAALGASKGGLARAQELTPEQRSGIARLAAEARWAKQGKSPMLRATHDGTLDINGLYLPCAVLEDGTRVLSERSFSSVLGSSRGGRAYATRRNVSGGAELPVFLASERLKPFIDDALAAALSRPIQYIPLHGGRSAFGIKADVVPKVCEVWLKARDEEELSKRQQEVAKKADLLLRGLAHVGIIALVDEATGYQDQRAKDALARILERFITKELRPWVKTFPVDYYKEIYRLREWDWPPKSKTHNSNLGKFTNDLVYDRLAPGVREELQRITPRHKSGRLKHRLHQHLTDDFGHPKLREHLGGVVMAMKLSTSWDQLMERLNKVLPRWPKGPLLPFMQR